MPSPFVSGFSHAKFYRNIHNSITSGINPENLGLILSASGWRCVFATHDEATDFVPRPEIGAAALAMALAAGEFFVKEQTDSENSGTCILLGCDARPTGPAIIDLFTRIFLSLGLKPAVTGVSAAPEIMSAAMDTHNYCGFCYISASHNPVGHNGVKLGRTDGGVLPGRDAGPLILRVQEILKDNTKLLELCTTAASVSEETIGSIYSQMSETKQKTLDSYKGFTSRVGFENYPEEEKNLINNLQESPLGVIGELNGSARGATIDADFFSYINLKYKLYNNIPGKDIVHPILPEGENLNDCCRLLETAYSIDPHFQIGYVPDNDGDRGNLVYINQETGKASDLKAQEVFALSVLAELSCQRLFSVDSLSDLAVAVNGPTSLRIEEIAAVFNARVYRAEVGEANVVNLARKIRAGGCTVRILGEGSNGGTITYPAAVRDPLNTILALTKLLRLKTSQGKTPAEEWFERIGTPLKKGEILSVPRLLSSLPAYQTTPTGESRAKYPVKTTDHNLLKSRYEKIFPGKWENRPAFLNGLQVVDYRFVNYEGTETIYGPGGRSGNGRGGFKVELLEPNGSPVGFLWMRGSGTEPVFRVMADIASTEPGMEELLIAWHRQILAEADNFTD